MTSNSATTVSLDQLYTDIMATVRIAEVPGYDEDKIWKVLKAYEQFYTESSVAFRTTTVSKEHRDLSVRYFETSQKHDPYAIALKHKLYTPDSHPIDRLIPEIMEKLSPAGCGVDLSVRHGFEKIWPVIGPCIPTEDLFVLESIPDSVKSHADVYARHGLDWIGILGVDYTNKSFNIYWIFKDPALMPEENVRGLIHDLGFKVPDEIVLEKLPRFFTVYTTHTWDSPRVERLSFAMASPAASVPTHVHPVFKYFVEDVPIVAKERFITFNSCYGHRGDYMKIEVDYKGVLGNAVGFLFESVP